MRASYRPIVAALGLLLCSAVSEAADNPKDDPYRWLEDGDAPAVVRWTGQQNTATRKALDALPGRAALAARFQQLYSVGSLGTPVSRARKNGQPRRYFYTRRDGTQNQPVLYLREGRDGADRPLVDVNQERADGTRALDWWFQIGRAHV